MIFTNAKKKNRVDFSVMFVQLFRIVFGQIENINKVNMCLARYSPRATTTSQPINRAPNEPAMDKNANFGPNWVVFGKKSLFLLEKSKVLLPT